MPQLHRTLQRSVHSLPPSCVTSCRSLTENSRCRSILQNAERVPPELLNGLAEAAEERRRRKYLAFDGFSVKPANSFSHRTGFPNRSDTESWPLLASPSEYAYQQCGISESRSTLRPEDIVQVEDQPPHKTVNDSLSPPSSSEGSLPREPQEFRSSREPGYKHTPPSHARDLLPLITGKDYYSENGPWSCLSSHDQVSLSCEHCSRAVRLSWQTGPSGRKLLCGDCGPVSTGLFESNKRRFDICPYTDVVQPGSSSTGSHQPGRFGE